MKFRKKPVVVDAFQYGSDVEPQWFKEFENKRYVPARSRNANGMVENKFPSDVLIMTLEGEMRADYFDFIIKGVNHEIYPCKCDIFLKTYEPVEEMDTDEIVECKNDCGETVRLGGFCSTKCKLEFEEEQGAE